MSPSLAVSLGKGGCKYCKLDISEEEKGKESEGQLHPVGGARPGRPEPRWGWRVPWTEPPGAPPVHAGLQGAFLRSQTGQTRLTRTGRRCGWRVFRPPESKEAICLPCPTSPSQQDPEVCHLRELVDL